MNNNNQNYSSGGDEKGSFRKQYRNRPIQTLHIKWWNARFYAMFGLLGLVILFFASFFIPESTENGLLQMLLNLANGINIQQILLIIACLDIIFILAVSMTVLKKANFDDWVLDIGKKRLSSEYLYYTRKNFFISYDRGVKEQDKMDYVLEISQKSEYFTYYLGDTYIDDGVLEIIPKPKCPMPRKADLNIDEDKYWNLIPLGDCVNNKLQKVSPVGWYLNDQNKNPEYLPTEPSTSYLISGGTGSGKSVAEVNIVGHISRNDDHFQMVGVDCKRVEFNLFRGVKGVKSVALDVKTAAQACSAFQKIMMDRFKFMEDMQVNNVYKIKNKEVDYYELHGKKYQFDEIFECKINDEIKIITIREIFDHLEKGDKVEIPDGY